MRLREAAQQALEALIWTTGSEDFSEGGQAREGALNLLFPAITSLRAALKQPEPRNQCGELCERAKLCPICCRTIEELEGSHLETVSPDMQSAGGVHTRVSDGADRGDKMRLKAEAQKALKGALKLCEWIAETPHQSGSINGLAAQVEHALRAALSDDAMQRLTDEQQMIERGTKAWAGVPDATAWVENLRGNEPVTDCHGLEQARAAAASNLLAHFGITSADSDVNVAYLNKQLDDLLTAAICCKKDGDNLPSTLDRPADTGKTSDHFPDAAKMVPPVAYVNDEGWFRHAADADAAFRATARPLYAAPPKREPLTVAEIQDVLRNTFVDATVQTDDMALIRAIERAHGIGGEK